jgi:hypothetical protein
MLTESNVNEFARRIADLFQHRDNLPEGVTGYQVYGGWFPSNLDDILADVQNQRPYAGDQRPIQVLDPVDWNAGYDGYIMFDIADGVLTVSAPRANAGAPAIVSVNQNTGAVTVGEEVRPLPTGWRLVDFRGTNAVVENGMLIFTLAVREDNELAVDFDEFEDDEDEHNDWWQDEPRR